MNIAGHDIGICSWSLRHGNLADVVKLLKSLDLSHLHLALRPLLFLDDKRKHQELSLLRDAGIRITAGMIDFPGEDYSSIPRIRQTGGFVPNDEWELRKQLAFEAGKLARDMGVTLLTGHIGYVPPSNSDTYAVLLDRVGEVGGMLNSIGVAFAIETGPEESAELLQFLNDLPIGTVGVNFDPANLILYGSGDPIGGVRTLGRHIRHAHAKDAIASKLPAIDWGREVPLGQGGVDFAKFFMALRDVEYTGPIMIEREAGNDPAGDIQSAITTLQAAAADLPR